MLKIEANPRYRTVGVGETVTYRFVSTDFTEPLVPGDANRTIWGCASAADKSALVKQQDKGLEFSLKFDRAGKFMVFGGIIMPTGDKQFGGGNVGFDIIRGIEYPQNVAPAESFMWDPVNNQRTHVQDPLSALSAINRYLIVLTQVGVQQFFGKFDQVSFAEKKKHEEFVKKVQESGEKLADRLQSTTGFTRIPVTATHRDDSTGQVSELNLFLAHRPAPAGAKKQWKLVDWTHPGDTRLDGEYDGSGATDADAVQDAIKTFEQNNQYPKGGINIQVAANIVGPAQIDTGFFTTGRSFFGTIADFLQSAAFVTGLLAVILTVAPIPGSQAAAAVLWLGIFSGVVGAAGAGLDIYERHARAITDVSQDGMDALSVVGCVLGVGTAWAKGATIVMKLQGTAREFVLVGTVGADAFQGVLVAKDAVIGGEQAVDAMDKIQNDKKLSPREKIERMLLLTGKMVLAGVMIYANVKGTVKDMARINNPPPPGPKPPPPPTPNGNPPAGPPAQNLKKLSDPNQKVDLTNPPSQTGTTAAGTHTTTVNNAPLRAPVNAAPKRVAAPGDAGFKKFKSFKDNADVPGHYRNDPRFDSLASDPAHGNKISDATRREAMAGLEAESQGIMTKPIKRGPAEIEFFDGDGHPWDVKAPPSPESPGKPFKFDPEQTGEAIKKQLGKSFPSDKPPGAPEPVSVLLDSTYMNKADRDALWKWLTDHLTPNELNRIHEINTRL